MADKLQHRKASKTVVLRDAAGAPIQNAEVSVKLVNHKFLFGCGGFDFLNFTTEGQNPTSSLADGFKSRLPEDILKIRTDEWLGLYNYATLPFYLGAYEPVEGTTAKESRMNAAKYLQSKGVVSKGHPLVWHTACADWLMDYDNKTILDKILGRINREVTEFKGVIDMWDVINETVIMPIYDRYDNALTRVCKDLGRVRLIKEVFDAAYAANPDATLLINDFNLTTKYEILIDGCLNSGAKINCIGMQTHQHKGYMGREKLEAYCERFEHFGLPMHFTENTLLSGHTVPLTITDLNDCVYDEWPSTPEGEQKQAEDMVEMYRILFEEHPLVEGITNWSFTDDGWLNAPAGLLRLDYSEKPAYKALKDLIYNEWSTNYTTKTNENGEIVLEGFKGDYELCVNGNVVKEKLG